MINLRYFGLVAFAAVAACGGPATRVGAAPAPATAAATAVADTGSASIRSETVRSHVAFLASDQMNGRDTPSPGLEAAAEYLAAELRSYGLEPAGDDGSFFQRWPYVTAQMNANVTRLSVNGSDQSSYLYRRDFFGFTSRVESASGQAVYIGELTALPALPAGAVSGQIVLAMLGGMPSAAMLSAGELAANAGAAGLVLIMDPAVSPPTIPGIAGFMEGGAGAAQAIPVFGMLYRSARQLLTSANLDLDQLVRQPPPSPVSLTGTNLEMVSGADIEVHAPANVVALVRGNDPALRDSYIAISAHFDHVGIGQPVHGDSIYNGADDNASGTSALLAIAKAFATLPVPPARSVIFIAVSGEEKGLLGSTHFVENPTVPIDRIVANINLDMVGRNHPDSLIIIGEDFSTLGPLARRVVAADPRLALTLAGDPDPAEQVFFRSDHFNFARQGIPALFFTSWLHSDYHQPSDSVEKIDEAKVARIASFVYHLTHAISADPTPPAWTPAGRAMMRSVGN